MRISLFILLTAAYFLVNAQDQSKPDFTNWSIEVSLNPIKSEESNDYIRLRYFSSPSLALRLGFGVSGDKREPSNSITQQFVQIDFAIGLEQHFPGTNNLSPYMGIQAEVGGKTSSFTDDENNLELIGAWDESGDQRSYRRLGFKLLAGADAYIIDRFYIGVEIGFGVMSYDYDKVAYEGNSDDDIIEAGKEIKFGPDFSSGLRIGFIF